MKGVGPLPAAGSGSGGSPRAVPVVVVLPDSSITVAVREEEHLGGKSCCDLGGWRPPGGSAPAALGGAAPSTARLQPRLGTGNAGLRSASGASAKGCAGSMPSPLSPRESLCPPAPARPAPPRRRVLPLGQPGALRLGLHRSPLPRQRSSPSPRPSPLGLPHSTQPHAANWSARHAGDAAAGGGWAAGAAGAGAAPAAPAAPGRGVRGGAGAAARTAGAGLHPQRLCWPRRLCILGRAGAGRGIVLAPPARRVSLLVGG